MSDLPRHPSIWTSEQHSEPSSFDGLALVRSRGLTCAHCRFSRPSQMFPDGLGGYRVSECLMHSHRSTPHHAPHRRQTWPHDVCETWTDTRPSPPVDQRDYEGEAALQEISWITR